MQWCPLPVLRICVDPLCPGWTSTALCLPSDPVSLLLCITAPSKQTLKPVYISSTLILIVCYLQYIVLIFFLFFFFGKTFSFCPHSLCASSVVLSSLRLLSTTTAILTDPTLLPEQATLAVTQDDTTAGPVPDNSLQPTTWNSMPPM